ncbi:tetratricopeptide repeat protein 37-like isoform X1 [Dreissena polymorpha]|uniref:tetratricopeptide repeat protein 37-like isoform X1 n=2 Tax=Dreissena polymorpha TaxID=45954 RepID=UPI002264783F|nr:tetratricopeptide repeat protein 37-like isoform X1 [Dreissena polymorpha]XP_052248177.1 tetratricopeptide repeat protein 37-like isoform X1 [Dreissena polymorpha]
MDPKQSKAFLRNARESIRKKEFKEAETQCKDILANDSTNYMALVLLAVAAEGLSENDQALSAYRQATLADDSQILAWQGLCNFFEKNSIPAYANEQCGVYLKLLQMNKDDIGKKKEIIFNMVKISEHIKDAEKIQQIPELCRKYLSTSTDYTDATEVVLAYYLPALLKTCPEDLPAETEHFLNNFPSSPAVLKHKMLSVLDICIGQLSVSSEVLTNHVTRYEAVTAGKDCDVLATAQACLAVIANDFKKSRSLLEKVCNKNPMLVCSHCLLAESLYKLHQYDTAIKLCQSGLSLLDRKDRVLTCKPGPVRNFLNLLMVQALVQTGDPTKLNRALEICTKELDDNSEVQLLKGNVYFRQRDFKAAKGCLLGDSVEKQVLEGLIDLEENNLESAKSRFESLLAAEPDVASHHLNLAKCLWKMGTAREYSFTLLLKAAKLSPETSEAFLYLGHYYGQEGGDRIRARKCYQKAFDLDPSSEVAGEKLCDFLTEIGEDEKCHQILLQFTSSCPPGRGKWAWLRLGLHQMKHDDPSVAIVSLQSALRADSKDVHVWECLGEAYMARGSYTAALKAFIRATELDQSSVYSLFQIASIKQALGQYTEALQEYTHILRQAEDYVPALKGLGETYVSIAHNHLSNCFHGRAKDTAELAVDCLFRACKLRPDVSCLWKLMGDACTILHVLPEFRFLRPDKGVWTKVELLKVGSGCYIRALKIMPELSPLWHDLGLNYIYQSQCTSGSEAISLAERSVQSLKKAIQLEPGNYKHWNALGYVACQNVYFKPDLAQHCFIKSTQLETNNVAAWTNLAALYLKHDNIKLGHEAFKIAQSLEPSYVACWIGQAIIAELVGHEDAMDLFRHTTELSNHPEGALGYGHWVCSMLLQSDKKDSPMYVYAIEQMAAIPAASDALARYTDRIKTNPVAYVLHGLLLQRQKLYKTAAHQLQIAVRLYEEAGDQGDQWRAALANCAMSLRQSGRADEACDMYERLGDTSDPGVLHQWGLALYQRGLYQQALQVYHKAAELSGSNLERSHVMAAMAMSLYRLGDLDSTKTTLFHSSQSEEVSIHGLKGLCALGLLLADPSLAQAAIHELAGFSNHPHHGGDILLLQCITYLTQGNIEQAKKIVQCSLHENPCQGNAWHLLSVLLLKHFPKIPVAATACSRNAVLFNHQSVNKIERFLVPLADIQDGYHGNSTSCRNAFLSAQRAVHLYPENISGWLTLSSAIGMEALCASDVRKRSLFEQQYYLLSQLYQTEKDTATCCWCLRQKVTCSAQAGLHNRVMDDLDVLMTEFGEIPSVLELFNIIKDGLQKRQ